MHIDMSTSRTIFVEQLRGKSRSQQAVAALLRARKEGATLREAAEAAGVHVATVCR
jgi:ferredoxin